METHSQASSAAEKKKRVETIVATKGSSARNDISEKAVASSTTSNGMTDVCLHTQPLKFNVKIILACWNTPSLGDRCNSQISSCEIHHKQLLNFIFV